MNFIEGIIYMLWRGIAIGIIISAPMGPVGILCVQRTLEKGRRTGFFTGVGAAISDMIYCLLTGFGLSFIEEFLTRNHDILQLIGSVVLIGFGIYLFKSNPSRNLRKPEDNISDGRNILNGFLFTFSNPLIIFLIIGLFARFNFFMPEIRFYHYVIGFLAIGVGALIWWWVVTFLVAKLRTHFNLRSMWLINKIIGGIIFIFAIVGIVTAVTAMSKAETQFTSLKKTGEYFNHSRGFTPFRNATDSSLVISAHEGRRARDLISAPSLAAYEFSFRASALNNASGKSYRTGATAKEKHPAWGILIKDNRKEEKVIIKTIEDPLDETYSPTGLSFQLAAGGDDRKINFHDGFDLFCGMNAFSLTFDSGKITLQGGNREYKPILSWETEIEIPDSIGFFVEPGGKVEIHEASLIPRSKNTVKEITEYGNRDILNSYLMRSMDDKEGIYKLFDRSLEEKYLRPGGDYTVALIRNGKGYDMIYLSGAKTLQNEWKPGMIKGRLTATGFPDVYDMVWIDATGKGISNGLKAQFEIPLLNIIFPYHSSSLRLRKTDE